MRGRPHWPDEVLGRRRCAHSYNTVRAWLSMQNLPDRWSIFPPPLPQAAPAKSSLTPENQRA